MKKLIILLTFILSSHFCISQVYTPYFQNNKTLDFETFLSKCRYAHITLNTNDLNTLINQPTSSTAYVISGLKGYLKQIGFEEVTVGSKYQIFSNYTSSCEVALVTPAWEFKNNSFLNLKLNFISCNEDSFSFVATNSIWASSTTISSTDFHNAFLKMYGNKKSPFQSENVIVQKSISRWTEEGLKKQFKDDGVDQLEGIFESTTGETSGSRYKLGLVKTKDGYYLIYLSGANNSIGWEEGELKARLFPTATPTLFKADWFMENKSLNNEVYIAFEAGTMKVLLHDRESTLFIKLFPTYNDIISSKKSESSSGTGFAISTDGIIATNHHVIEGATSIRVRGIKGNFSKSYNATILIDDKKNDLALIKIEDLNFTSLGSVPFLINKKNMDVGSSIFVLGYPLITTMGNEVKLTNGIISSSSGYQGDITSYQMSAPVQPGNSGGPVFDSKGNLVGIINAKYFGAENASYAIKSIYLLNLFESLSTYPKLQMSSTLINKALPEQVKLLKNFIYIIEVEN
jgi:S1-C subfamily serine protease